jgi:hypothetical protein
MVKLLKHFLFGIHDTEYNEVHDYTHCTICGKLFSHSPLYWFARVTRDAYTNNLAVIPETKYWLYDTLPDYLKQTSGPMAQSWKPGTLKLKQIPAPPKPPDMDELDWKLLNDMVNECGIRNDED